ncbi:hypothetical protein EN817_03795 [Mesorhizobium sp. M3A.F.Ca.ET.174.01.1.1]|uniref:phage tail tape measure protein n=1 Tax=unclassified Mesorhizobium TaxID=325217 RepID=UPI001093C470|nr:MULTISPECIES: phage tail tape measure protein [unclassified Mesorhizobium]TGS89473.1 hypothetical protein EN818_03795 [Mesorhizobium sp. M3A.F.Ca.ET.175.01.1.1]TGT31246.1 hypothetical protein EN817_03795 [Mesorhizobium sp. M3A.F.Ca.ET.174.01.1.1]
MAKNTITTRIALDGGKEIESQLKALGETGERAFKALQKAAASADFQRFAASLSKAKSDLVAFGQNVAILGSAIASAAAGAGAAVLELASSAGEAADEAGKAAQSAGVTTEAYTALAFAAKMSNLEQADLDAGMARLNKTLGAAANGSKAAVELFQKLGVSIRDSTGKLRSPDAVLLDLAQAFSKLPDGAEKSALAIALFGKTGAKLIPFLNEGKKGLIDLGAEAKALGVTFTDAQAKIGDNLGDALDSVGFAARGVRLQLGLIFAPAITTAANALTERIKQLRPAIQGFAQDIANKALPVMLDFVNALTGKDADVSNKWVLEWRDGAIQFGQSMGQAAGIVLSAIDKLRAGLDLTAKALNGLFGTHLSGDAIGLTLIVGQITGGFKALYSSVIAAKNAVILLFNLARANPWVAAVTAIAGGLLLWATRTDAATAALQRHEGLVEGVKNAYAQAGNAVKNMTDEIKNGLILQTRGALKDLVPAFEAEIKRLRDLAAAPAKDNPFSSALRDFANGGDFNAYLKAVAEIGASNPKLNDAALAFLKLAENAKALQDQIKPSADFLDLLTGKITDAQFQARQAGAGFQALGADANAGLNSAGAAADATKGKVEELGRTITVIRGGGDKLTAETFNVVNGVAQKTEQGKQAIDGLKGAVDATSDAVGGVSDEITNSISQIAPAAAEAASGFNNSLGNLDAGAAQAAAEAIIAPFSTLPGKFSAILSGISALLQGGFSGLSGIVSSLASQIESAISRILASLRAAAEAAQRLRAAAAGSGSSDSGGSHGGFAGGGYLASGPGTPTSDSIPIWASVREFIMQAKATAYYGPGFMHALNQMKIPREFFTGLRGFNMGGIVDGFNRSMSVQRFAGGGSVKAPLASASGFTGTMNVKLDFGLGPADVFELVTDQFTANRLGDFANKQRLATAGRTPGRGIR